MVDPYTPDAMIRAFWIVSTIALLLGLIGLIKLEPRSSACPSSASENYTVKQMMSAITANPVARVFFIYLFLLLAGILGQDVLLEPLEQRPSADCDPNHPDYRHLGDICFARTRNCRITGRTRHQTDCRPGRQYRCLAWICGHCVKRHDAQQAHLLHRNNPARHRHRTFHRGESFADVRPHRPRYGRTLYWRLGTSRMLFPALWDPSSVGWCGMWLPWRQAKF